MGASPPSSSKKLGGRSLAAVMRTGRPASSASCSSEPDSAEIMKPGMVGLAPPALMQPGWRPGSVSHTRTAPAPDAAACTALSPREHSPLRTSSVPAGGQPEAGRVPCWLAGSKKTREAPRLLPASPSEEFHFAATHGTTSSCASTPAPTVTESSPGGRLSTASKRSLLTPERLTAACRASSRSTALDWGSCAGQPGMAGGAEACRLGKGRAIP
mmetsp:Transcript_94539/g.305249  ORF Transcript_94539/g.305249 Transcript_94539/m.305249 type:complete len:214 (+) Transcript_94539:344-985(+)